MKKTKITKFLSLLLCVVLIAVIALFTTGCTDKKTTDGTTAPPVSTQETDVTVLGTGKTTFLFSVTNAEGEKTDFEIHTDKKTVGEALMDLELIDGDDGEFGLYVKTVNGITLDYNKDGKYWAFYENGQYANAGVDLTEIVPDTKYEFRAEN